MSDFSKMIMKLKNVLHHVLHLLTHLLQKTCLSNCLSNWPPKISETIFHSDIGDFFQFLRFSESSGG